MSRRHLSRLDGGKGWRGKNIPGREISNGPKAGTFLVYQRRERSMWLEQSEYWRKIGR